MKTISLLHEINYLVQFPFLFDIKLLYDLSIVSPLAIVKWRRTASWRSLEVRKRNESVFNYACHCKDFGDISVGLIIGSHVKDGAASHDDGILVIPATRASP